MEESPSTNQDENINPNQVSNALPDSETSSTISDSEYELEKQNLKVLMGNDQDEEENEDLKSVSSKFSTFHEKPQQPPPTDGLETNKERIGYYSSEAIEKAKFREAGKIESITESFLTIAPVFPLLNLDALVFLLPSPDNPILLGPIDDVFGQITLPKYSVVPDSFLKKEIEQGRVKKGDKIYCEESNSKVLTMEAVAEMKKRKYCDGSNAFDEEIGEDEREFSDDEEEARRKNKKRIGKKRVEMIEEELEDDSDEMFEEMESRGRHEGNRNQDFRRNQGMRNRDRMGRMELEHRGRGPNMSRGRGGGPLGYQPSHQMHKNQYNGGFQGHGDFRNGERQFTPSQNHQMSMHHHGGYNPHNQFNNSGSHSYPMMGTTYPESQHLYSGPMSGGFQPNNGNPGYNIPNTNTYGYFPEGNSKGMSGLPQGMGDHSYPQFSASLHSGPPQYNMRPPAPMEPHPYSIMHQQRDPPSICHSGPYNPGPQYPENGANDSKKF